MTLDTRGIMNGNHGRVAELTSEVRSLTKRMNQVEKHLEAVKEELIRQGGELNRLLESS